MAWIDDRIWCHPKFADLSSAAFRLYVCGVAYSSGFGTRGYLTRGQQRQIGAAGKTRGELITAGLWDEQADRETVYVHDWDVHNAKRDARREADRVRKREARQSIRASLGTSAGQSAGTSRGASTLSARVDGSEGSEGSEEGLSPISLIRSQPLLSPRGPDSSPLGRLRKACAVEEGSEDEKKLVRAMRTLPEAAIADVAFKAPADVRDRLGWTLAELKKRRTRGAA